MPIHVLSEETINKIAAGEVVERPAGVVKELIENAIDAGATAISVEIKDGGTKLIRVTDNGCGIPAGEVEKAFLRHATSKIRDDRDLTCLSSLGFRGEALSSIAAVSQVEMITKPASQLTATRACNPLQTGFRAEEPVALEIEEIGAPDGTSVIVRNLFYNVPVRRKFLRQPQTEAGYVTDLIERQALSHPGISFHYRINGQDKLHTTGSGDLKELIYRIYGREMSRSVIPIRVQEGAYVLEGFLGRPEVSRSNRNTEIFFVNGRMLHSQLLSKALEAGYRNDLMQHRFPFAILHLRMPPEQVDVNVHPTKMEARFSGQEELFDFIDESVHKTLHGTELIPHARFDTPAEEKERAVQEREDRSRELAAEGHEEPFEQKAGADPAPPAPAANEPVSVFFEDDGFVFEDRRSMTAADSVVHRLEQEERGEFRQQDLFSGTDLTAEDAPRIMLEENRPHFRIIGQVFGTYWMIQYEDKLLIIDQHAAHEKVNYERLMKRMNEKKGEAAASQMIAPPAVITLTGKEEAAYLAHRDVFARLGFEIEQFGAGTYAVRGVPTELYGSEPDVLLRETLDELVDERLRGTPKVILAKIASMSCKAAVKGNSLLRIEEAQALIDSLLRLEDPYHCPHGRPTILEFSQTDLDKKFKRIV